MAGRVWCFYHIQGEEGEIPEEPNAFQVSSSSVVTLKQLASSFPLNRCGGVYHFRFKVKDDRFGWAWQDARDPMSAVPMFNGAVYAKVLRLDQLPRPASRLRRKAIVASDSSPFSPTTSQHARQSSFASRPQGRSSFGSSPSSSTPPQPPSSNPGLARRTSGSTLQTPKRTVPPTAVPERTTSPTSAERETRSATASPTPPLPRGNMSSMPRALSGGDLSGVGTGGGPPPGPSKLFDGSDDPGVSPSSPPAPAEPAHAPEDLDSFLYGSAPTKSPATSSPLSSSPRAATRGPPTANGFASRSPIAPPRRPSPNTSAASSPGPGFMGMDGGFGAPSGHATGSSPSVVNSQMNDIDEDSAPRKPPSAAPADLFGAFVQAVPCAAVVAKEKEAEEEEQQDALKARLGPKLDAWSLDPQSKKLRNVRTLISTVHDVLWEGCQWKPVFLGDLMAPDRVKFHYRKAMLILHPDKNVNGTAEQKLIAEKVFTCVNEAYNTFSAQELK